ncbi:hypothetical protein C0J52_06472 [Blattella germanica]|nr:hypothetical protein C0J52_06472 [Blattella germanica]
MKSLSQTTSWNKEWATQYPLHVAISRKASSFTRLAEPYKMKEIATPRDPMVALPNETKTVTMRVDVIDDLDDTCKSQKRCYKQERVEECENQCGYGTGKGMPLSPDGTPPQIESERLDVNYSTCTHDIKSCPDLFCDPLEQLYHRICPQDCAYQVSGGNSNNGIGILSASTKSVCVCHDSGTCACAPPHNGSGKVEGKNKNKENNGEATATAPAYANTNTNTSFALTQLPRDPNNVWKGQTRQKVRWKRGIPFRGPERLHRQDPSVSRCSASYV